MRQSRAEREDNPALAPQHLIFQWRIARNCFYDDAWANLFYEVRWPGLFPVCDDDYETITTGVLTARFNYWLKSGRWGCPPPNPQEGKANAHLH
jgi:hypothetical protein